MFTGSLIQKRPAKKFKLLDARSGGSAQPYISQPWHYTTVFPCCGISNILQRSPDPRAHSVGSAYCRPAHRSSMTRRSHVIHSPRIVRCLPLFARQRPYLHVSHLCQSRTQQYRWTAGWSAQGAECFSLRCLPSPAQCLKLFHWLTCFCPMSGIAPVWDLAVPGGSGNFIELPAVDFRFCFVQPYTLQPTSVYTSTSQNVRVYQQAATMFHSRSLSLSLLLL